MFELGEIDDLVVPRPRSTTGRALASMSLRRTFEACKGLDPDAFEGDARGAALALRAALEARLPGDPHGIAHAIADPVIGAPLRAALRDPRLLPQAIDRLLIRLGDREGTIDGEDTTVFGRIRTRSGDPWLARCAGVVPDGAPSIDVLRESVERLRVTSPEMHDDLGRFASVLLVTDAETLAPTAIGMGTVPATDDADVLFRALVTSIVRGKILALVEGREHDERARVALIRDASRAAVVMSARMTRTRSVVVVSQGDPLRHVADELARLGEP